MLFFLLVDIVIPTRLSLIFGNFETRLQHYEGNSGGNTSTAKIFEWKIFQNMNESQCCFCINHTNNL